MSDEPLSPIEPPADPEGTKRKKLMTNVAVGIGSAAIVAALLYANRPKKDEPR